MFARLPHLLRDRNGATAVEYGLILATIVIVLIGALSSLAGVTIHMWSDVAANVTAH